MKYIISLHKFMNLILTSQDDLASLNIREKLLSLENWKKIGTFHNFPVYKSDRYYLVHIKVEKIRAEGIDMEIKKSLGIDFGTIIVASKHRSASNMKSLTVHPIGNWSVAEAGGKDYTVVPTNPYLMTEALRLLKKNRVSDYNVSFEATHHGPYLETPTFFIEIGSTEEEWKDDKAGEAIAKTILALEEKRYPAALGFGGGHYVPRLTDVALEYKISFGHMIPKYAVDNINERMIEDACRKSQNCRIAYIHRKGLNSSQRKLVESILDKIGVKTVSSKELEKL